MVIRLAESDSRIAACYPVMRLLRPNLAEKEFVDRVAAQWSNGYRLALAEIEDNAVAVAGFRILENLAWGRFLYVDDLVTAREYRSRGIGTKMLVWLREYGKSQDCKQLHLDSGMQRKDAHRFYLREGMENAGYHFAQNL